MALTRDGGKPNVSPCSYSPPQGPSGQMRQGPGLGGDNHGNGTNGTHESMKGSPGIGGSNHGNSGSQR